MKVLLAPDKFKGSLTAAQVADHLGSGLTQRGISYRALPLADGGDGSVDAAIAAGFRLTRLTVAGATGHDRPTIAAFDGTTAVVEVANTCGLHTLPSGKLDPLRSSSLGLGQAITTVLRKGATRVVLALGGSASTDGGAGTARRARHRLPRRHRAPAHHQRRDPATDRHRGHQRHWSTCPVSRSSSPATCRTRSPAPPAPPPSTAPKKAPPQRTSPTSTPACTTSSND